MAEALPAEVSRHALIVGTLRDARPPSGQARRGPRAALRKLGRAPRKALRIASGTTDLVAVAWPPVNVFVAARRERVHDRHRRLDRRGRDARPGARRGSSTTDSPRRTDPSTSSSLRTSSSSCSRHPPPSCSRAAMASVCHRDRAARHEVVRPRRSTWPATAWRPTTSTRTASRRLRAAGVDAHRLQLGAVPVDGRAGDRARRSTCCSSAASTTVAARSLAEPRRPPHRAPHRDPAVQLRPARRAARAGLVFGDGKYDQLAAARSSLLNIHRGRAGGGRPYFEWARMVEAMANRLRRRHRAVRRLRAARRRRRTSSRQRQATSASRSTSCSPTRRGADLRRRCGVRCRHRRPRARHAVAAMLDHLEHDVAAAPRRTRAPLACHRARQVAAAARRRWRHRCGCRRSCPFRPRQRQAKRWRWRRAPTLRRLDGLRCLLHHGAHAAHRAVDDAGVRRRRRRR